MSLDFSVELTRVGPAALAPSLRRNGFQETGIAQIHCLSTVEPEEWDQHAERLDGSFFHCYAYGQYESIRSNIQPLFVKALDENGECVGVAIGSIVSPRFWPFASCCRTAVFGALPATKEKTGGMQRVIMLALEKALKRRGVYQVQVSSYDSPNSANILGGLSYNLNDRCEFYIDLSMSLDYLGKSFKGSRRTDIRKAEKSGVETQVDNSSAGLRLLDGFQAASMQRRGVEFQSMDPVGESAKMMLLDSGRAMLLMSSCAGRPINAAMFALFGHKAYYLYSGSSLDGNKQCGPVHLLWTAIQLFKAKGFSALNLGGACALHEAASEKNLYNFKRDFGALVVTQPAGMKTLSVLGASLNASASCLKRIAVH